MTCKTALEDGVPDTKQSKKSLLKSKNQEFTKHSKEVLLRLENTKEGQNVWQIDDKFGLPNVKSARMSHIYKKLDRNKPAYTVTDPVAEALTFIKITTIEPLQIEKGLGYKHSMTLMIF